MMSDETKCGEAHFIKKPIRRFRHINVVTGNDDAPWILSKNR